MPSIKTDPESLSVSVFSNEFIELFRPEKHLQMNTPEIDYSSNIITYSFGGGILVLLFILYWMLYYQKTLVSSSPFEETIDDIGSMIKHTINQYTLWFYLGKPNEIHAVKIPENSKLTQLYDSFDILHML